jgi:hypothetical protein
VKSRSKVDMLPGVPATPTVLLAKIMEDAENIEALAIVVQRKGGDTQTYWTQMKKSDAVWMAHIFRGDLLKGE